MSNKSPPNPGGTPKQSTPLPTQNATTSGNTRPLRSKEDLKAITTSKVHDEYDACKILTDLGYWTDDSLPTIPHLAHVLLQLAATARPSDLKDGARAIAFLMEAQTTREHRSEINAMIREEIASQSERLTHTQSRLIGGIEVLEKTTVKLSDMIDTKNTAMVKVIEDAQTHLQASIQHAEQTQSTQNVYATSNPIVPHLVGSIDQTGNPIR